MSWTVYILRTASGRLYTGITTDLARRFAEHRVARGPRGGKPRGARSLRGDAPRSIAYAEPQPDRGRATRREAAIKRLSRAAKLALIDGAGRGRRGPRSAAARGTGR